MNASHGLAAIAARAARIAFAIAAVVASRVVLLPGFALAGPLHPTFPLLDENGASVLTSGAPVSATRTCGTCHDVAFIASHDSHATSGAALDCFLCHLPNADDGARRAALVSGTAAWATTATLARTGVVDGSDRPASTLSFRYLPEAFLPNGHVRPELLTPQDPPNEACGACHGAVHMDLGGPFVWTPSGVETDAGWRSLRIGQVYSPQARRDSGLNLEGKSWQTRSWDVHAERGLDCVDCHHANNNPIYRQASAERPAHLRFDARRIDVGSYLERPDHVLAHGPEPGEAVGTMRDCATCHDAGVGHAWLPYPERHFAALSCASCHVPEFVVPTLETVDATVTAADGTPRVLLRGVEGPAAVRFGYDLSDDMAGTYVRGAETALLPRRESDGSTRLVPHNLVTTYRWVEGASPEQPSNAADPNARAATASGSSAIPVPAELVTRALYDGQGRPRETLLEVFDENSDGAWSAEELRLDAPERIERLRTELIALGVRDPRIEAVTEAHAVLHGVTTGPWALRDCRQCHDADSRIGATFSLAGAPVPPVSPVLQADGRSDLAGAAILAGDGTVRFEPAAHPSLYVLGRHASVVANRIGLLSVLLVTLVIGVHATLRTARARRARTRLAPGSAPPAHGGTTVYMYTTYERFWHWLQAVAIFILLLTGLEVHFPGGFRVLGFDAAVRVHNVIAFVVVLNAALAAFYHFASGEIRQFLPEPRGFFRGAIEQTRYYLHGIFHGAPHPFEKHPGRKLNVLQQVTYLAILNLLLPLQVGTGILIWGAQRWSAVDTVFGGLGILGPIHALGAWLFAAFLVAHIYLTTTGPTPTAYVKAMVTGWEGEAPLRPVEEARS